MQAHGIRVISPDGDFEAHPRIIGDLDEAGPVDVIVLGVKAHGLTQLAPRIKPLIGENTTVVSTQNGIPWWYFQPETGEFAGLHLERVDPGGVIAESIIRGSGCGFDCLLLDRDCGAGRHSSHRGKSHFAWRT